MSTGSAGARRAAILATAMVGVLGVIAAPAMAAKKGAAKLRTAAATASASGAFDVATATAVCPKGTRVLGGGYTTTVPAVGSHWLNVHESQRSGGRGWRVSGAEFVGSDTLTAYAYCAPLNVKIKARSAQVAVPTTAGSGTVVQALCPKRTVALSGGFSTEPANASDSSLVSRSIGAGGSRWVVDVTRLSGAAGRTLSAHVYCAPKAKVSTRFEDAAVSGPLGSTHTAITPGCPKGTGLTGGGFATSSPVGGLLNAALVYETKRAGAGWTSSATPSSGTTSITLVTNAYCR